MTDSPSPTSNQEDMLRMVRDIYDYGKKTGDWLGFRAIQALLDEVSRAKLKSQRIGQTKKNMAAITRNLKAQYRARNAQQPKTAKKRNAKI